MSKSLNNLIVVSFATMVVAAVCLYLFMFKKNAMKIKTNRTIKKIIIHSTATPEGVAYTVSDINRWHVSKGYGSIGYHFVIGLNGELWAGRDIDLVGAHARGANSDSIGIVYVGGTSATGAAKDTRTEKQKKRLEQFLKALRQLYPEAVITGHKDHNTTACPSFNPKSEYADI